MPKNFLIVGGGISGHFVALHLKQAGHNICIIDNNKNQSSRVAAGLINPIVFRRMAKSWRIDALLDYAKVFYKNIEQQTHSSILKPIQIRRLFSSRQEFELWKQKENDLNYISYLYPISKEDNTFSIAKNQFGSGRLKQAYHVDAETLFNIFSEGFWEEGEQINEEFEYHALIPTELKYKDKSFDGIVFCEGKGIKKNPFFQDVKVDCTKGELITIQHESLPQDESLNRKCFVLPLGDYTFKVGSTYVWHTDDNTPTKPGKSALCEMLSYITDAPFKILKHEAGVRPTTYDRRPYCGEHHQYKNIFCFNGLGAKGYLLAPLLAKELTEFILFQKTLNPEVGLYRNIKK
jgi:glycine/D-amino acid oxidase-like deaminating enzyme